MAKRRRKQIYRVRQSQGGGRIVTAPDGTVSIIGASKHGFRVTGQLKEPFASLFADPPDPKRIVKAFVEMDPVQRERIEMLHEKLHPKLKKTTAKLRPSQATRHRTVRPVSRLDRELADRLYAKRLYPSPPNPEPDSSVEPTALTDAAGIAKLLAVPQSWVYEQAKQGLPHYRLGRYLRFDPAEVKQWLAARRRRAA